MGESAAAPPDLFSKRTALLPPYTTGIVRIRSNLDIKLGRAIGGWQWRAADRRCASRCGHSSRGANGLGVAFVGSLYRRIDSRGVDPRSLISSPGKARDRSPAPRDCALRAAKGYVSWMQLREGSALSSHHFDSTTTAACVTLKWNGGRKGAKPATIPGFNYSNQNLRLQPAARTGAVRLFWCRRFAPLIHRTLTSAVSASAGG
jgi:hypothetical protein